MMNDSVNCTTVLFNREKEKASQEEKIQDLQVKYTMNFKRIGIFKYLIGF